MWLDKPMVIQKSKKILLNIHFASRKQNSSVPSAICLVSKEQSPYLTVGAARFTDGSAKSQLKAFFCSLTDTLHLPSYEFST